MPNGSVIVSTSLTPEQIAARRKGIGGSDARRIMAGDWLTVWQEKTGRRELEDFSDNLAAMLGIFTEPFNRAWYAKQTGRAVMAVTETVIHPIHAFMLCHLDGVVIVEGERVPWEGKHTNAFGDPRDAVVKYYAQVQHQIEVTGASRAELSVIYGNSKWQPWPVFRDPDYIAALMQREEEFWQYVERDEPPPGRVEAGPEPKIEQFRTVNMSGNNMWADSATTWIETLAARRSNEAAEAAIKGMVEKDVGFAFGHGVVVTRARNGNLSLREPNKKDLQRMNEALEGAK